MFKKRARSQNLRKRDSPETPLSGNATPDGDGDHPTNKLEEHDDKPTSETLQQLLLMRKLNKQGAGIDLIKLNKGEEKKRNKKGVTSQGGKEDDQAVETYGLKQSKAGAEDNEE